MQCNERTPIWSSLQWKCTQDPIRARSQKWLQALWLLVTSVPSPSILSNSTVYYWKGRRRIPWRTTLQPITVSSSRSSQMLTYSLVITRKGETLWPTWWISIPFQRHLGLLPTKPVHIEIKSNAKPFYGCTLSVPKANESMISNEVKHLCHLNVLCRCNKSEWAEPSFGTPKKNGQIQFVSDFCQLNKWIIHRQYPMPSIHNLFKCFEGFTYCTALDLNMGFWTILLDKPLQCLCTIVHLTLGKVLLPPSSNGTCLFTRHIPRENVRTIHRHDLCHSLSRRHTCTYLRFIWWPPTTTWKCFQMAPLQQPSSQCQKIKLLRIGDWIPRLYTYERRYQTATTKGQCNPSRHTAS